MTARINVELIYIPVPRASIFHTSLQLSANATAADAITASSLLTTFPNLVLSELCIGIFSKKVSLSTVLQEGDRVEIYRPLLIDPKTKRRQKAKRVKGKVRS